MEKNSLPNISSPISCSQTEELVILNPAELRFWRDGATLRLTIGDRISYRKVLVMCSFPLTHPDQYWGVYDGDKKEIGLITDPQKLSKENRTLCEEELKRRYILPQIEKIVSIYDRFGFQEWVVETDLGRRKFGVRNLRENVFRPSPQRYLLTDADNSRYEIKDFSKLDSNSQSLMMQHL